MNKQMQKYTIKFNKIIGTFILIAIVFFLLGIMLAITSYFKSKNQPIEEVQTLSNGDDTEMKTYDTGDALLNPGKGFVLRGASNQKYDDIVNIGYKRFYWKDIEPEEGVYDWTDIDRRIEDYAKRGKKFVFGVLCASSSVNNVYVTPKWVFDAGAKYYPAKVSDKLTQFIPVWTDPIFIEKINNFVKKLAERYDGNESIAYIDIRSYGNWGEQHLWGIKGEDISSSDLRKSFIEPYRKYFKKTLLVNPWGKEIYDDTYKWAIDNGISIRRDGIMKHTDGKECFDYAYGKLPTIFEYFDTYEELKKDGLWGEDKLINYIEEWKPSYIEFFPEMYEDNPSFCKYIANKIGYYFKFKEAKYTNNIKTTENNSISLKFTNEGVAPLYEPCTVYIGLLDKKYNLVKKYKTDIDPHTWMPNEEVKEEISLKLKGVETGSYIIALGLFYNESDEKPTYLLGNTGKTDDKWYVFGKIDITCPDEEYTIKDENLEKRVKEAENYKLFVGVDNLREEDKYKIKLFINNDLRQTIDIDSNSEKYEKDIIFKFDNINEENNIYRLQIEKNNTVVKELIGEVLITDFIDNYITRNPVEIEYSTTALTNQDVTATLKTTAELTVNNNQNNKQYTFKDNGEFTFEYTIKGRKFTKKATVTNIDKIPPVVTGIENDGFYTEKVTPKAVDSNLQDVKLFKNNNQITNYTANSSISDDGAYRLEAVDKAGNETIVSFDICKVPATITYSETNLTNKDLIATIVSNYDIQVTNNSNKKQYTFTKNGTFTFEYKIRNKEFKAVATVNYIDKEAPSIAGIEDNKLYIDEAVTPIVKDANLKDVKLYLNSLEVKNYKVGDKVTEQGFYKIVATDLAGNESSKNFNLMQNNSKDYKIKDNVIVNVSGYTNKQEFAKKLNNSLKYQILRNGQALGENDYVATGDTLKLENGKEFDISVTGDLNGDGKVNITDVIRLRKYILTRSNLNKIQLLAADTNLDEKAISVSDLIKLRLIVLSRGAN